MDATLAEVMTVTTTPPLLPKLARGKHRSPRRGACFMELASYLAGEKWSDKPPCTHADLAHVARLVNDLTTDLARPQLAVMIPSVIGHVDLGDGFQDELALITAHAALPIAALSHQRAIAVGLARILGLVGDYRTLARNPWHQQARGALLDNPGLHRWAREFIQHTKPAAAAPSPAVAVTEIAICAIAEACITDPDGQLRLVLENCITWAHQCSGTHTAREQSLEPHDWEAIVTSA